jgi:hypothetical protein
MRHLLLATLGVLAISSAVSAQQPQYYYPAAPKYPAAAPAAAAGAQLQPVSGTTIIRGNGGCTNCGTPATQHGPTIRNSFTMANVHGGNCGLGAPCQNGCGSVKSDLAFHFGTCKQFFSPCGPTIGGLWKGPCPSAPMAQPFGTGWGCPRGYDSYANH